MTNGYIPRRCDLMRALRRVSPPSGEPLALYQLNTTSMTTTDNQRTLIRNLNDRLRQTGRGGRVFVARGAAALTSTEQADIARAVTAFDAFTEDNDPWGEHDCATLTVGGNEVIFKIDYYDTEMECLSPAPWDAARTRRVLTILLTEEY